MANEISIKTRAPILTDTPELHKFIENIEHLDLHSHYVYMLIASHFRQTSIVAECEGEIVGFISAYILPEFPNVLFIWQVGVKENMRKNGLATIMFKDLIKRPFLKDVNVIDTTIAPSNEVAQRFFQKIANELKAPISSQPCFSKDLFGGAKYEEELLYRIGPFKV